MSDESSIPVPQPPEAPAPPARPQPPFDTDRAELEKLVQMEPTRGSGPGGQRRNKVETGVRLVHPPSGIVIVATRRASRQANIEDGFQRLIAKLEALNHVPKKRRPTRPSASNKQSRLDSKKRQSDKKASRRSDTSDQ